MSRAAAATWSGSGSAAEGTAAGGIVASPSANTTSIGRSTNTGPRCGVSAVAAASWTTAGMSSTAVTVRASLVTGASRGTWSSSCSEPEPQRACGARPPSTTTAEPLKCACVMAEMPLVTPGPAVSTASPGRRVSRAWPSAAKAAVCSCRTSTMRVGGSRLTAASYSGKTCPPDSVNSVSTPKGGGRPAPARRRGRGPSFRNRVPCDTGVCPHRVAHRYRSLRGGVMATARPMSNSSTVVTTRPAPSGGAGGAGESDLHAADHPVGVDPHIDLGRASAGIGARRHVGDRAGPYHVVADHVCVAGRVGEHPEGTERVEEQGGGVATRPAVLEGLSLDADPVAGARPTAAAIGPPWA